MGKKKTQHFLLSMANDTQGPPSVTFGKPKINEEEVGISIGIYDYATTFYQTKQLCETSGVMAVGNMGWEVCLYNDRSLLYGPDDVGNDTPAMFVNIISHSLSDKYERHSLVDVWLGMHLVGKDIPMDHSNTSPNVILRITDDDQRNIVNDLGHLTVNLFFTTMTKSEGDEYYDPSSENIKGESE